MDNEVILKLNDETILKLEKLAKESGATRDELICRSLRELLDEVESLDS